MLTDEQRRLYARQVLLRELGTAGQARLCECRVVISDDGHALATRVARDYLERAGLAVQHAPSADASNVAVATAERVQALAGTVALADCAAWLLGAFAAVETIKRCVQVGSEAQLDSELVLNAEVV